MVRRQFFLFMLELCLHMISFLSTLRKLMEKACIIFHISEILSSPELNHQIFQFFHSWRFFYEIQIIHGSCSSLLENLKHQISTNWVFFMKMLIFVMVKISSKLSAWSSDSAYFLVHFLSTWLVISSLIIQFMNWDRSRGNGLKIWKNDRLFSNLGKWFYFLK